MPDVESPRRPSNVLLALIILVFILAVGFFAVEARVADYGAPAQEAPAGAQPPAQTGG